MRRTQKTIDKLIAELERTGIPLTACSKAGISRSTYYRWRQENITFKLQSDEAIRIGRENITDLAESKLVKNISDGNQRAIEFQLRHNDARYKYFSQKEFAKFLDDQLEEKKPEVPVLQTVIDVLFDAIELEIDKLSNDPNDTEIDDYTKELLEIEGKKNGAMRYLHKRIEAEAEKRKEDIHAHYVKEKE